MRSNNLPVTLVTIISAKMLLFCIMDPKQHWENVYTTKQPAEVSWTQEVPQVSLDFIHSFKLPKTAGIIDIGGGDSTLVDHLLKDGYENITVLDISEVALEKAKKRLGANAAKVTWIVSDITQFKTAERFDVWHDRATFHFLTSSRQVNQYLEIAAKAVKGFLAIGTFSVLGPDKCSGLPVRQYSEAKLSLALQEYFIKIRCITEDHSTPFNTTQNFLFCSFKRQ